MGLARTIRIPGNLLPTWEAIREHLGRVGLSPSVRLIDGLPAFPDELPDPAWKELRIGLEAGMVTIRRDHDCLSCIIWGNADPALEAAWKRVIWACAAAGEGLIEDPGGPITPEEFARSAGLSPV